MQPARIRPHPQARRVQQRAAWARTNGDLTVNEPDGFPSMFPPVVWWWGSDQLNLNASWNYGGWNSPLGGAVSILPAVTRLTALITDPLSSVPWKQVEEGFGGAVLSTPRWLTDPCLLRPDDRIGGQALPMVTRLPRSSFWSQWLRIAVWHGQAGLIFIPDTDGQPTAGSLRTLHPQFLRPARSEISGTLVWEIGDGTDVIRTDRDGYFSLGSIDWRLVVLRDPHAPIDTEGHSASVFERHPEAFGLAQEIESYSAGVFRGNGVPNGILKVQTPGLTQEQADGLKAAWMAAHGTRKSIGVLNATTDFQPLSITPLDAALIENKRASMADMALAFAFDPNGALGISMGNSGTYVNEQAWFGRLKADLLPWVTATEELVSSLLPAGRAVRMDFSELTRPDPLQQYQALQLAVSAGLLSVDEARNILGLPPMPEGEAPPEAPPQLTDPTAPPTRERKGPTWLH